MSAISRASAVPVIRPFLDRISLVLIFLYQVLILIALVAVLLNGIVWIQRPFIGAFVDPALAVQPAGPLKPGSWEFYRAELLSGYRLVAIDGQPVYDLNELSRRMGTYQVGDEVALDLVSQSGTPETITVRLQAFPVDDRIAYLFIPFGIGIIYLLASFYVFSLRRNDSAGRSYALFTAAAAFGIAGLFDAFTTKNLTWLWTFSLAIAGGSLISLAVLFPNEWHSLKRRPFLRWAGFLPAALILTIGFPAILHNGGNPYTFQIARRIQYFFVTLAFLFFFVSMIARRFQSQSPLERQQARLMLWGSGLAFIPLAGWFLTAVFFPHATFSAFLLVPLVLFPLVTTYAILRYRLLYTDFLLSRSLVYLTLTVGAIFGYALLVSGLSLLTGGSILPANPLLIGGVAFGFALALNPVRLWLQQVTDRAFFRRQAVYRTRLDEFSRELNRAVELPVIFSLLREYVDRDLMAEPLHVFVYDPISDLYKATEDRHGQLTSDFQFQSGSMLVRSLAERQESIFLNEPDRFPAFLEPDKVRISLLGSLLFVPLSGQDHLSGWLALGPRKSGEPYENGSLRFLSALCDQAALAIERARIVADLERRVQEMNVLTRVAQGTNFTLRFDDILELIYTQTSQVIPTRDFRVVLKSEAGDSLHYAFYLENDERLPEYENVPVERLNCLEAEVIKSQSALITSDYGQEARNRGYFLDAQGIYAWMGVPLDAGTTTIGVISLGSRDPLVVYREEQLSFFQAIADQTAGAIVKTRLLEETERRAYQMATLNVIGRGLTSTLEIKPLLGKILSSAVEILNCESGNLSLVDPGTGELVLEVAIGAAASELVGKRLLPGTGVVGEAVEHRQAVISNDAKRRKGRLHKTGEPVSSSAQDLLAVPMMVQDRVIGVIEVINKLDGSPFNLADQELLMTFASQATIAIENARLYTLTDQALAARVEELSVMQRVDRELNASLDVSRAMRITLEWAIRQSRAAAGLVAMIEKEGMRVMAAEGYPDQVVDGTRQEPQNGSQPNPSDVYLPLELPIIQAATRSGQPVCLQVESEAENGAMLSGARVQVAVPIRREAEAIGVILLEDSRDEKMPEEDLIFLSRLSDHAAIAISNAQLYAEVEAANFAKSKFVSFVAHELKNPMASIKGYTELVAGGMAGPVNEMQSSFLATIRSNVDRMNTIVSDLNDLTKIQVGSMRLDFKSVSLNETINEVVRSLSRQIDHKEQFLDLQIPADLPRVWADAFRLGQVLTNLISNANKYTPNGGTIRLGAERKMDGKGSSVLQVVQVWVQDTGIGIPEEDRDKIFQQYFRTEKSKETANGTGLGLNISKSLVEMQGGQIWFESREERGTTFYISIPVAETG